MALKKHPDRGGNPEEFQSLSNAYERLLNHKQNPSPFQSFHNVSQRDTTMHDIFNEDIFKFAFNRGFPPGAFHQNATSSKRIKIRTQIINGQRKTTVEHFSL